MPSVNHETSFSSTLPIVVLTRPAGQSDWQVLDEGPGFFTIPAAHEAAVRLRLGSDAVLRTLIPEIAGCPALTYLNLSENRGITDRGLEYLSAAPQITMLNLSSCDVTNEGLRALKALSRLEHLELSYCNRLTDNALLALRDLTRLEYLDLLGCLKMTHAALKRFNKRGLIIHR